VVEVETCPREQTRDKERRYEETQQQAKGQSHQVVRRFKENNTCSCCP
jgi:hypothetical protein